MMLGDGDSCKGGRRRAAHEHCGSKDGMISENQRCSYMMLVDFVAGKLEGQTDDRKSSESSRVSQF
jgi:hypothetical protein